MTRSKKVLFAIAAAILVPSLLLALLEGGLRIAGYGYPTSYFLTRTIEGKDYLTENDKFGWRFFPPELARSPTATRFEEKKAAGTYRIFVFGESAALGDPKPAYGMGRYLETLLRKRFPTTGFEVIPVAMTAINSHALVPIARECARLGGDFWILYMGNNEMMGPFGANPISGPAAPSLFRIRALLALRATRTGQLLEHIIQRIRLGGAQPSAWQGMKTFLEHNVPPGDPARAVVYANYQKNLEDIARLAIRAGAKPILCTVAGNLKDCAPFASVHSPGLPEEQRAQVDQLVRGGNATVETLIAAAKRDDIHAGLRFRLGERALAGALPPQAAQAFGAARDLDALPFRTDSKMNDLIRSTAGGLAAKGALLVDVEQEIARQAADGLPDEGTFFDHVHFTFAGNYRVARLLADQIAPALPAAEQVNRAPDWASAEVCDASLGLTDWNRRAGFEHMLQRISEPPFATQLSHARQEESLARRIIELRSKTQPTNVETARAIYLGALGENPEDFRDHENFAEFLEAIGETGPAIEQWQQVSRLLPYEHAPYYQIGRLYAAKKDNDQARAAFARALKIRPDLAEAMSEIGLIDSREGKYAQALEQYAQAARLRPQDSHLRILQADALAASGDRGGAMGKLREAAALRPDHWEAHYLLGVELASTNRIPEAVQEFRTVTRLRPNYAQAHFNLGVALAKTGQLNEARAEFKKTLEADPAHKLAAQYLEALDQAGRDAVKKGAPQTP